MAAGAAALPETFRNWFAARGWAPRAHQLDLLAKAQAGRSTLLIAPTGAGKTLAGFLPTLVELSEGRRPKRRAEPAGRTPPEAVSPLHTLYISPLKALAVDIARNLETPIREMELPIRVETRTGDTPSSRRQRQRRDPPDILLTTPEQLALLLASKDAEHLFSGLKRVILDELHALVTSKRGDLLALALARLRRVAPGLQSVGFPPPWPSRTTSDAIWWPSPRRARRWRGSWWPRGRGAGPLHPRQPRGHAMGDAHGGPCAAGSVRAHQGPPHEPRLRQHALAGGIPVSGTLAHQ